MAPAPHLKLTHPKKPLSSYNGSSFASSSASSSAASPAPAPAPAPAPVPAPAPAPDVPDCDNPLLTTEWVDSSKRTEDWVWAGQHDGSRANSPVDTAATPPRQSGTPDPAETSAPERSPSASRSRSLSAHGSPRPLPSAAMFPDAAAPSDGERGIERKAPGGSIWSASPRLPARRAPVSVPDDAPAPSQSPSAVSGPRDLISISSGSKRTRDTGEDGAGERSSQRRRRSASPGCDSRRPSASVLGDEPASSPSPPVSGPRALGSTSSGSKRTRDVEDDGAGETSPQRRRTASIELPPRRPSASASPSGSGSGSSRSTSSGERSRPAPYVRPTCRPDGRPTLRPGYPYNSILEDMMENALEFYKPPEPAVAASEAGAAPSIPEPVVEPPTPAVDAAVVTDRVGSADLVAAPAQPVALAVVAAVNIVDIEPADGPAVAVETAVEAAVAVNPGPLPDRAESRLQARIDALFARSRGRRRADRFAMYRSLESWLLREELIMDLQDRELA